MPPEQLKPEANTLQELEEKVHRLESQLSLQASLLDHVHSAVIATDTHEAITHWNRFAEKLYQWRAEEFWERTSWTSRFRIASAKAAAK